MKGLILLVLLTISGFAQAGGQVCFYEHAGFVGRAICLAEGQRLDNLDGTGLNDQISSIRFMGAHSIVQICRDAYFRSDCRQVGGDVYNLEQLGMNDTVSSISVGYPLGGAYPPPSYPGGQPGYDPYYSNGQIWSTPQSCRVSYNFNCTVFLQFRMDNLNAIGIVTVVDYGGGERVVACYQGAANNIMIPWITRGNTMFRLRAARSCGDGVYNSRVVSSTVVTGY